MKESFGIIITCYVGDFFLTKALLASISKFMPHIPICIIKDGDFSIEIEKKTYKISHIIQKKDVKNEFLRETCFGSRCTNMIAFWESPFERFLYIDSDTVAWGDITKVIDYKDYDFVHNTPHEPYTESILHGQYFNYQKLFSLIQGIDVERHHFFNAGVFFAKRGIFSIEEYKKIYMLWKNDKTLFGPEPQGMINYMVFKGVEDGLLTVGEATIQNIVPVCTHKELNRSYTFLKNEPVVIKDIIIHWAGLKPLKTSGNNVYNTAAFYFRKLNLKKEKSFWFLMPNLHMYIEEYLSLLHRYHNGSILVYLRKKVKKCFM